MTFFIGADPALRCPEPEEGSSAPDPEAGPGRRDLPPALVALCGAHVFPALRAWALQVVRREFARWAAAIARWVSRARRRSALGAVFAAWGGQAAAAAAAARAPQ